MTCSEYKCSDAMTSSSEKFKAAIGSSLATYSRVSACLPGKFRAATYSLHSFRAAIVCSPDKFRAAQ